MANFNVTLNMNGNPTVTQNVTAGDTVTATINCNNSGAGWDATPTNCTLSSTFGNSGTTCVITVPSAGSYSVFFTSQFEGGKSPTFTNGTVSGTAAVALVRYGVTTASTKISMSSGGQVDTAGGLAAFFGDASPTSLSEFYRGGPYVPNITENNGVPTTGTISLSQLIGVYKN